MKTSPNLKPVATSFLLFLSFSGIALAGPVFTFVGVSNNSATNTAIGETQLSVEVNDAGSGQTWFIFQNAGPDPSSITQIYFDDAAGVLDSFSTIDNSDPGVAFSEGATPGNLPAGNLLSPAFTAESSLTAGADAPPAHNGINPGESLGILANPALPYTYDDVLDALASGTLRIGLHVQAFADGGSESFVTGQPVPAPGAVLLTSIGLGVLSLLRNRQITAVV